MSRISYCSLEEAWGDSFNRKDRMNQTDKKSTINNKIYDRSKYDKLLDDSEDDRKNIISNMNNIERNSKPENNNSLVEYNKYRFNPYNNVKENDSNYNKNINNDISYTPYKESIEKKYLQDKINFLESQFMKLKYYNDNSNQSNQSNVEYFDNSNSQQNSSQSNYVSDNNDLVDLIILIIIGLMVIFVLNSIFNIGKVIGARQK